MTPKVEIIKEKLDKLDFIKIQNIFALKFLMSKVKRQLTTWKKLLANHVSDKRLVSRVYIYVELLQLNKKETNNPI